MLTQITSVSFATALELVQNAVTHAAQKGWNVAAHVVDAQGIPLAMVRMDGAAPPVADFAADKAYTAATMRRSTEAFADRMGGTQSLALGLGTRSRLITWGGGVPIAVDGTIVGGLGVSGAKDHEDIECARVALLAAGFDDPAAA